MFSRLSPTARLLLLQAFAIVMMLVLVSIGMKFTGRSKSIPLDERDGDIYIWNQAPVAVLLENYGWTLLAVPLGLAVFRLYQSDPARKNPYNPARFAAIGISLTLVVLFLGSCGIQQAFFESRVSLHRHPDPPKPTER